MALIDKDEHQTEAREIRVPIEQLRDAAGAALPAATAGAGQMAVIDGGWGSGGRYLEGEAASGNTKTATIAFSWAVPIDFEEAAGTDASKSLVLKVKARVSAVANTTASIDAEVYISDDEGGASGGDQVTTSAQTHNSATWTEFEFAVTSTNIEPGKILDSYLRYTVDDSGGSTGSKAQIGKVSMAYNGRG